MTEPAGTTPSAGPAVRWCEDLLLALRLREVPGERIGAVLAEVRDHLLSSGDDPVDVFGTAEEYAAALTADRPQPSRGARALEVGRNAAGVAGVLWAVAGGTALLSGGPAVLTEQQVVLPVLLALAVPRLVDVVVRARRSAALGWGALVTAVLVAVALLGAWVGPLVSVEVPAAGALVPGLLVAAVWTAATTRTVDPVVGPLQDAAARRRQQRRVQAWCAVSMLLLLVVPVAVLVAVRHLD